MKDLTVVVLKELIKNPSLTREQMCEITDSTMSRMGRLFGQLKRHKIFDEDTKKFRADILNVEEPKAKRKCTKKAKSPEQIQRYILQHGKKMTNKQMADYLEVARIKLAGGIAALKRTDKIDELFLCDDVLKFFPHSLVEFENNAHHISEENNRIGKLRARAYALREIDRSGIKSGKILSLPASKAIMETEINRKFPKFTFEFAEIDNRIFRQLLETSAKASFIVSNCYYGEIINIIEKAKENEYAHLILDYCASLKTVYEDLLKVFKSNIVQVGGTVSITFSVRCGKSFTKDMLPDDENIKNKNMAIFNDKILKLFPNYKIANFHSYRDGNGMLLIIVKRIK